MSPLARLLLALAVAQLLHASNASDWMKHFPCAKLDMGIIGDRHTKKESLNPIYVPPHKLIVIPNVAKPDEALVGQRLMVCDILGQPVTLKPVSPKKHSPITVHCSGGCPLGVIAYPDQYIIKQLP